MPIPERQAALTCSELGEANAIQEFSAENQPLELLSVSSLTKLSLTEWFISLRKDQLAAKMAAFPGEKLLALLSGPAASPGEMLLALLSGSTDLVQALLER